MRRSKFVGIAGVFLLLIFFGVFLFLNFRFDRKSGILEEAYAIPEESTIMSNEIGEEYHDLSSQGEIEVGATLNEQELFLIQNTVKTNSTKIVIENKENSSIKVYLYYSTQPESSIQEMEVDSLSKGVFENLSSAYLYKIGVILAESNSFKIVVSDN